MTEDERELLRRLEKLNSNELPQIVAQMFLLEAEGQLPAEGWRLLADIFAALADDLRQQADAASALKPVAE